MERALQNMQAKSKGLLQKGSRMKELIGFWLVAMTITTFLTIICAFDDSTIIIKVLVMVGTMLAMLIIGLYLMEA